MTIEEYEHGIYYSQSQWLSDDPPLCQVTVQLRFKGGERQKNERQKNMLVTCNFDLLLPACIAGIKLGTTPRAGETLEGFGTRWIVDGVEHSNDGAYGIKFELQEI